MSTGDKPGCGSNSYNGKKKRCPRGHRLIPGNLVVASQERGWRNCLSCQRARSYLKYHTESKQTLKEVSDAMYQKVLEERRLELKEDN